MGKNFRETLNEQLKDPEFKKEWEATEAEFQIIRAIIDAQEKKLTQEEFAEITGISIVKH